MSPHLASYRERIQVNGKLMSEDSILKLLPEVLERCVALEVPATLFEVTFLLACLQYRANACDAVVLEVYFALLARILLVDAQVGMGGELDATNVVNSSVAVLCSVALDHTRVLGSTVEAIGHKKAGIFKPGRPALVGPQVPMDVMKVVTTFLFLSHNLFDTRAVLLSLEPHCSLFMMPCSWFRETIDLVLRWSSGRRNALLILHHTTLTH